MRAYRFLPRDSKQSPDENRPMTERSTQPRKGQAPPPLTREAFAERFAQSYYDPAYDAVKDELKKIEVIAWDAYSNGRKAPRTSKAGPEFADPNYDLSVEWRAARDSIT